jgi:hypothetical protein
MRITIRPMLAPERELDVTEPLVRAIAGRMADEVGGNEQLNLLEAEVHLRRILRSPAAEAAGRGAGR